MSKFNVGDTVTVQGTITASGACCGPEYTVEFQRHQSSPYQVGRIVEEKVTLVKKAAPTAPAAGTVIDWSGYKLVVTNKKNETGFTYLTRVYSDGSTAEKYFVYDDGIARSAKVLA